ncbi:hypothetical protein F406_gp057 [Agrobacterium phage 7-7-1]|uniref:Uncharacterized protein n=1 Tax=Agrobacterium phage 7-7-1 TaxID=1161931 RepID=J7FAR2_9CAUD|nr:hypothetical protein F406_gp057 [Agrobacterium phage 7-7-1]AFH19758.1 hypothetical protein 7-7-1_00060 [Agrobacterium phage 7-7-1]
MSRIEISHNATPLSRELYVFDHNAWQRGTRLVSYAQQTRATTRHKFKGPVWDSNDERIYMNGSQLARPTEIPGEVLESLKKELIDEVLSMTLFVGWFNEKHVYKDNLK